MTRRETSAQIARRGRAMAELCRRVRERGGVAEVEELEDLPVLRMLWLTAREAERALRRARRA